LFIPTAERPQRATLVQTCCEHSRNEHGQTSQMTEIILSQWVIASALGALCLGLLLFCLVPTVFIIKRMRRLNGTVSAMRIEAAGLKDVLERLADKQIEAAGRHQEELGKHLSSAMREPLEGVVKSIENYGKNQNEQVSRGLQQQMMAFADRLDQLLGGQVAQARELQDKTLRSLETTIAAFQDMAASLGETTEGATQAMVKELRAGINGSLSETENNVSALIGKLGAQVTSAVAVLEQQAMSTGTLAIEQQKALSEEAQRSMEVLLSEVRTQTQAIDQASQSMRSVGTDVGHAVDRIIEGMTGLISGAAKEIMRSGEGFKEIFDKSEVLSKDLKQTAATLAVSSKEISVVVSDYRKTRDTLKGVVDLIRSTAEAARTDASLTANAAASIEAAAQRLVAAQGKADEYLNKLNGVLSEVDGAFKNEVVKTAREFHEQLSKASSQKPLSEEMQRRHTEFDRMISDWVTSTPQLKQGQSAAPSPAAPPPAAPALASAPAARAPAPAPAPARAPAPAPAARASAPTPAPAPARGGRITLGALVTARSRK
jgi:hypothetical protein